MILSQIITICNDDQPVYNYYNFPRMNIEPVKVYLAS